MPVYEYCCEECGEKFELLVRSLARKATPKCPRCGSIRARKALSLFGVGGPSRNVETEAASCGPGPT